MTILRVILDDMLAPNPGGLPRYTAELASALIEAAPRGCTVEGFVAASPEPDYETITRRLPGLALLHKSALARRELSAAWQHGFTRLPGSGMVHAPSLFAPLSRHDRLNDGDQIAVSIHDTIAWSHPESLSPRVVSWHKAMVKRAQRYADAVVVPSHSVADQLREIADFGDRVRVIAGAPSSTLAVPVDADERAARLGLPEHYVLAIGAIEPRRGIDQLIRAMAHVHDAVPLLLVGHGVADEALASAVQDAGLDEGRVRNLGSLSDADLAVALSRASVFAYPNLEEGFGMPMLEAFAHGTPVVHSDAPALLELAADAGIVVERDGDDYPARLADGINSVLSDKALAERLHYIGTDRAKVFTWRGAADKVWQLHADL
ncbi:glycosyltransferase involved in cell wall biosynthesis [Leifsonia sp. AK011]|uniref:glycosyltransferase family 4 protein n=1 Tax=Leifsonia sp. AK011 TaxID=2723075 RepID=UPI0015C79D0F|nr:glycosyltransferase family 1 protein [Leifsonia sp. AK011]NYF11562.1 glycosyltransferase involved in cell wall biosynthesis [Leifsonia sp. AK011]